MAEDYIPGVNACIHLIYPNAAGAIKTGTANASGVNPNPAGGSIFDIACTPGSKLPQHATSETVAVTCPACKVTAAFKKIDDEQQFSGNGSEADKAAIAFANDLKKQRLAEIAAQG